MPKRRGLLLVVMILLGCVVFYSLHADENDKKRFGKVEVIRDTWGIPHVFAETDEGAFYGLGYATAEDRAFQMYLSLRIMQGRLAETVGNIPKKNRRRGNALDNDRRMRTFGFFRAAKTVAENIDKESRGLLQAYCDGVNDYIFKNTDDLSYMFKKYKVGPEPWTPADCIVVWWHMAQFFAGDGTRDYIHYRNLQNPDNRRFRPAAGLADDAASVVKRSDVGDEWVKKIGEFLKENGFEKPETLKSINPEEGPKFSHAWVVGKDRTTTKSAVLCSDPQTTVTNPSLFYEYHLKGKTFNARGIGVPGSPIILIGWTENVAWGVTALGADQADLFRLKTDDEHPGQYFFNGEWKKFKVIKQKIKVKKEKPVKLEIRETCFGPVVTEFSFMQRGEGEVALKRIPMCETDRETIQGAIKMMRAKNAAEFLKGLGDWRFPTANVVFGDKEGNIGFSTIGAIPLRSPLASDGGGGAHDGTDGIYDWKCIVPAELYPQVINPKSGYLFSGNHRPIEKFYPSSILGISTGSQGDTVRSWRLRELHAAKESFTPQDVLNIHLDTVNPVKRDLVRFGLHLRDVQKVQLSSNVLSALKILEPWYKSGASIDLTNEGSALAQHISTNFRMFATQLALKHGGGQSGLCKWLKELQNRIAEDPKAKLDRLEVQYIQNALTAAWRTAQSRYGRDTKKWREAALEEVTYKALGYYEGLDGFPSLDPEKDYEYPGITCTDGNTIKSQGGQSYSQWVPMHDVDSAMSILPIGQSELPGNPMRWKTYRLWKEGKLHAAPLSRKAVEKIRKSTIILPRK
ncbi:MAG: penicillin acylase family protein [Planctomycetota bacterium]|nr:MAG: penicillin acylase family protein [Planctomycetota bacterium]